MNSPLTSAFIFYMPLEINMKFSNNRWLSFVEFQTNFLFKK